MAVGFLRRSISRRSIHRTSQARALSTRVSDSTLCLLGQSKKAIGHKSQIGPCVATHPVDNHQACCFRNDWRRHHSEMELQGRGSLSPLRTRKRNTALGLRKTTLVVESARSNSWAECREIDRHRAEGEIFLLTFLFIGLVRFARLPGTIRSGLGNAPNRTDQVGSNERPRPGNLSLAVLPVL